MPRWQTSWIFFFTHLDHESIKKPYTYELFQVLYTTYETVYSTIMFKPIGKLLESDQSYNETDNETITNHQFCYLNDTLGDIFRHVDHVMRSIYTESWLILIPFFFADVEFICPQDLHNDRHQSFEKQNRHVRSFYPMATEISFQLQKNSQKKPTIMLFYKEGGWTLINCYSFLAVVFENLLRSLDSFSHVKSSLLGFVSVLHLWP